MSLFYLNFCVLHLTIGSREKAKIGAEEVVCTGSHMKA